MPAMVFTADSGSAPSLPFASEKRRDTTKVRVSTSTNWSSIMHVEYWCMPSGATRLPWGMVQVTMRAISVALGV